MACANLDAGVALHGPAGERRQRMLREREEGFPGALRETERSAVIAAGSAAQKPALLRMEESPLAQRRAALEARGKLRA